jgi:predicted MFS family arabinose efflux permease
VVLGVYLWCIYIGTGISATTMYSSQIFRQIGGEKEAVWLTTLWGLSGVLAVFASSFYAEVALRRSMIICGCIVNAICLQFVSWTIESRS